MAPDVSLMTAFYTSCESKYDLPHTVHVRRVGTLSVDDGATDPDIHYPVRKVLVAVGTLFEQRTAYHRHPHALVVTEWSDLGGPLPAGWRFRPLTPQEEEAETKEVDDLYWKRVRDHATAAGLFFVELSPRRVMLARWKRRDQVSRGRAALNGNKFFAPPELEEVARGTYDHVRGVFESLAPTLPYALAALTANGLR